MAALKPWPRYLPCLDHLLSHRRLSHSVYQVCVPDRSCLVLFCSGHPPPPLGGSRGPGDPGGGEWGAKEAGLGGRCMRSAPHSACETAEVVCGSHWLGWGGQPPKAFCGEAPLSPVGAGFLWCYFSGCLLEIRGWSRASHPVWVYVEGSEEAQGLPRSPGPSSPVSPPGRRFLCLLLGSPLGSPL